ncbi:polyprenyl synthetase family protein [Rhodopseudomonas palustris]|uniref:polyprenyl synthetase family protein n=1 Tax=Rhodopseudomonas palustris TaxID=1076 RepID=UPI000164B7DB|nr:polyprenyl synthetase family protein [Rhodopseudomonas palustris]ACF00235.1 Polyprenyl synthetase [Rhodopseudomonas palustris TIE-1]QLH70621.1 polyprenyl synthetase family protein [Rhodopseudomonas palustris]RHZ96615.1 geranylgeranyl pyrophosphate synthase [Rhodopseudomonas palustris]WBU31351.1 polyprenyl synthetase family protein [Rhodopseudomonas palustris]
MDVTNRIERALTEALNQADMAGCPPRLAAAMRSAVFPRGARVRPRLCHSVALACGEDNPGITEAAGAALELMHCASLIHDDLPCFDGADLRRGRPSVHKAFGEPLAVLAGDAMIVLAFQTIARAEGPADRLLKLTQIIGGAVGVPFGIVAGQAWECETEINLAHYHRSKTGALFVAATAMGAASAGSDPEPWRMVGEKIGEAYQVADDLRDAAADVEEIGKPVGQDVAHDRPSAVREMGIDGAIYHLKSLVRGAVEAMPECTNGNELRSLIMSEATRLVPAKLAATAA